MNDLRRELAPFASEVWAEIDEEAKHTLTPLLAGRHVVDFVGPLGWEASSVGLGRTDVCKAKPADGVTAAMRRVQPLVELRAAFTLSRDELDAIPRGAQDADLDPVRDAARAIASAEDRAIFHGFDAACTVGICQAAADATLEIPTDYVKYPGVVAAALSRLRDDGVGGPYAIALGPRCYRGLMETTTGGYPVVQHVKRLIEGPIVWAPSIDGACVVSLRGGDFELTVGRDLSIGYHGHDAKSVDLYLEESVAFRVLGPEAAVPLAYGGKSGTTRVK